YLPEAAFHVYYAILFGLYFASMMGLFSALAGERTSAGSRLAFAALLLAVHSALGRWLSYEWLELDYPWYLQSGVAGQYVLGAMFQPSTFGVLLILSIVLFVRGKPFWAIACACLGATVHSTYLLPAAFLTLAYMTALLREGRPRRALALGGVALVLVVPV